ncbi:ClbS/DfsB family four-helix bundle protein [Lacrimispora sp.]|uniref:ClbS/DfsB family four-helix bundle protein n=1 Tax=Lacrimispora sp. TaxID=2719234 RepID=UPI003992DF1B
MQEYKSKEELIAEIKKTADAFIMEFDSIEEADKDKILEGVDRSPAQMIAYQLGWMNLLMGWDRDELAGKEVVTPAAGYKWNRLGGLYESFYRQYEDCTLCGLRGLYRDCVAALIQWLELFSEEDLFGQEIRTWASSTPSKWPIWKWVHINTVAPFKTFRSKVRKWKKLL